MEIAQTALVDVHYTALGVEETTHVARTLHVYNSFTIQQQSILLHLLQLHRQNYPYSLIFLNLTYTDAIHWPLWKSLALPLAAAVLRQILRIKRTFLTLRDNHRAENRHIHTMVRAAGPVRLQMRHTEYKDAPTRMDTGRVEESYHRDDRNAVLSR